MYRADRSRLAFNASLPIWRLSRLVYYWRGDCIGWKTESEEGSSTAIELAIRSD